MKYAILLKPNMNLPFFEETKKMCEHELSIMCHAIKVTILSMSLEQIGAAFYLIFETEAKLDDDILNHLSYLSFYYTIFEVNEGMYKPLPVMHDMYFGEDLSNRLKYSGKTNEAFTRMMINMALYSSKFYMEKDIRLFDPVCGKGTTLFEGMIRGYHGFGAELNKQSVGELGQYFQRYLKEGRYKHQIVKGRAIHEKKTIGETFEAYIGQSKEEVKKKTGKQMVVFRGDTTVSNLYFKNQSMHIIVGDLPYGVHHMSKHDDEASRSLDELLKLSFKSWYRLLRKGGTLALSWNTYTNDRQSLTELLEAENFTVIQDEAYLQFHHRVSQAINRDIIVARK